jgi:hypothetical protein
MSERFLTRMLRVVIVVELASVASNKMNYVCKKN